MKNNHFLREFYDSLIHVPLTFWGLDNQLEKRVVSLIDLSPTILDIAGIEKPTEWYGRSLFSNNPSPAISEDIRHGCICISVRTDKWIYAFNEGKYFKTFKY